MNQTDWDCGFYVFPNQRSNVEYFNCGITKLQNTTWLVARKRLTNIGRVGHNRIAFWELRDNKPVFEREVQFLQQFRDEHHEDPRVIVNGKRVLVSYCNFRPYSYAHQCIAEIKKDFRAPQPIHVQFGKNGRAVMRNTFHEKNWIWFFHENELYFSYATDPHVVCKLGQRGILSTYKTDLACPLWKHGELRGGSPPVRIGDEYFCFVHSSMPWKTPLKRYYMGAYAFEAKPPFKITRYTPNPLLCGSDKDPRNMGAPIVVFPCGNLFDGKTHLVTMGINDCRCAYIKIPHEDLIKKMVRA